MLREFININHELVNSHMMLTKLIVAALERRLDMILPLDWDKPSDGNEELCKKFSRNTYREGDFEMPYRLFKPKTNEPVPFVVYLHGADAVGDDNILPLSMHDIGTCLAKDSFQLSHPCYILAPQYDETQYWNTPAISRAIIKLINQHIEEGMADKSRIYIYGYSAGGVGTLFMLSNHPDIFAAAIAICGVTGRKSLKALSKKPLWLCHAIDDTIVRATYRQPGRDTLGNYGSRDIYEALMSEAKELKYTEYPKGWMKMQYGVNPHCSWVAVSDYPQIWEWLISKRLSDQTTS